MKADCPVTRRVFLATGAAASVAGACSGQSHGTLHTRDLVLGADSQPSVTDSLDISEIPIACAHEHWGSIDAIGTLPEGYRADVECGATPGRQVQWSDILLDPYFNGCLHSAGQDPEKLARAAGKHDFHSWAKQSPGDAYAALRPALEQQELTGTYQCIRRGLLRLHEVDISDGAASNLSELDERLRTSYSDVFAWYREAMRKERISLLVRPVHPEYYFRESSSESAEAERRFTRTVLRIDPLLHFRDSGNTRREALGRLVGVIPEGAESWRAFLAKLFDIASQRGAVGIKQLQAYGRVLAFPKTRDEEVSWSGEADPEQVHVFQNWVVNECCRLANERDWPHQVHVGTHNLGESSPLPLADLAGRYPRVRIVMLHCWPFLKESGWLAKYHPNVFIDTCWMPVLNPHFLSEALRKWIGYVPTHKIMCGQDSTSVEMAVGSSLFTRESLAEALSVEPHVSVASKERIAHAILNGNAYSVYGLA